MTTDQYVRAAEYIVGADALLITAGAGMGVDSGLPDFRGTAGFWAAYPALGDAQILFEEIATPHHFHDDPKLAWGFYGHRLSLYRRTEPHSGFRLLKKVASRLEHGAFVFTSNVDGQFQKAGFDETRIVECHGSIHGLQCLSPACLEKIWRADGFRPQIDASVCRLKNRPPTCPKCAGIARPNILMFDDWNWIEHRTAMQRVRLARWLNQPARLVTIELGAGTTIPTVRRFGNTQKGPLIRINPTDESVGNRNQGIGIRAGAREGLEGIQHALESLGFYSDQAA